jgi:hypothetical protein
MPHFSLWPEFFLISVNFFQKARHLLTMRAVGATLHLYQSTRYEYMIMEVDGDEAFVYPAAAQQFPMWSNAVLPDCFYGRACCCAQDSSLLLKIEKIIATVRFGSIMLPGLFLP